MGQIADMVAEGLPTPPPPPSKLDRILSKLDDEDRAIVLSWLEDLDVTQEELESRFRAVGISCSDTTIRRWRRQNLAPWAG